MWLSVSVGTRADVVPLYVEETTWADRVKYRQASRGLEERNKAQISNQYVIGR